MSRSKHELPRWIRDGSGVVDSGAMTSEHIAARLGYLEQGLAQLAETNSKVQPRRVLEQYVARYFDDFGPLSQQIFWDYLNEQH